jgi:hypothetical protein
MADYLNGVEILGTPKTVRLEGTWRGETHSAPMECWIAALVETLSPEQKDKFFTALKSMEVRREHQRIAQARIVADIPMPNLKG